MKDRKKLILKMTLLPFLIMVLASQAQQSKTLALDEAIELSIKNSKHLRLGKARIEEAIAATKEAMERRLPDAIMSGAYMRLSSPAIDMKTASNARDSNSIAPAHVSQVIYGMANLSLPIYSGLKITYGIESAKFLEEAVRMDEENDRQGIILNTIAAYINLYKANAAAKLVEENLVQSRQRDTDFSNLEKNGLLARNDLLKAQLETSNQELVLVDAENDIKLAMVNMNLMLGLPESTILNLDSNSLRKPGEIKTIEEYEQLASQNRSDVKAMDYRLKAANTNVKVAKGDYYPGVALTGGYIAADIPKFLVVSNALNIGVGVKYSVSSLWKTSSKVQQAKARVHQLEANEAMLNDQIHLSINKAYQDYLSGLKKIEVYNKALEQATENYRINKNKYNNNLLTLTDLLDADVAQLRAKMNLTFAKADLVLTYQTLLQKAGLLNQ
ncbi:TolC family protein [Chitinophagaceae bacterium LB-8]|uniref:TolC family protein n=1 Tax=Paraflavisolibacter caeni TaxID=2982496 RepID=A0A9X3BA13_9BACT|nr:TolC family protein [Paraflavisolibacter caeni]MCU7552800.1 TolC family protein [Paraflavisolibacter caeni]